MRLKQKIYHLHGFTLVELTIVIVVIAILAGVSVVGFGAWRQSIAQKEVQTDLQTVAVAMISSRNSTDVYPASIPSSFKPSPNVQLTYITGSSTGYCIEGVSKTNSNVKYYISSNSKTPMAGTCAGIVLLDESGSGGTQALSCNSGDTLSGTTCTHIYTATYQSGGYSCPSGGALSGTTCTSTYNAYYSSGGSYYGCPSGGNLSGSTCYTSYSAQSTYYCTSGTLYQGSCWVWEGAPGAGGDCGSYGGFAQNGPNGYQCYSSGTGAYSYSCPSGGTLSGTTCSGSYAATYYSYSGYYYCTGTDTLSGTTCTHTYAATQGGGAYTCPSGGTLSGTTCTQTYPAF